MSSRRKQLPSCCLLPQGLKGDLVAVVDRLLPRGAGAAAWVIGEVGESAPAVGLPGGEATGIVVDSWGARPLGRPVVGVGETEGELLGIRAAAWGNGRRWFQND